MSAFPSEVECKRAAAALDRVLGHAFEYARRKKIGRRLLSRFYDLEELWENFPENWEDIVPGMLVAGALFGRPKPAGGFVRSMGSDLRREEERLARLWRKVPWIYGFFEPVESLGNNLLRVRPLGDAPSSWPDDRSWEELVIYSPSLAPAADRGCRLMFAQLCCVGEAFLTYGVVIPFASLQRDDAYFLADVAGYDGSDDIGNALLGIVGRTTDISDVIAADPVPFIGLFANTDSPQIMTKAGASGLFASCLPVRGPKDARAAMLDDDRRIRASVEANGEQVDAIVRDGEALAVYGGEGSPMYDPVAYFDSDTGVALLSGMTRAAYDRGRAMLSGILEFPETPQVRASMSAYLAADRLIGIDDRLRALGRRFDDLREEATGRGDAGDVAGSGEASDVDAANAVLQRLSHAHNEGFEESDEQVAGHTGVDPEIVTALRAEFEKMLAGTGGAPADGANSAGGGAVSPGAAISERYGLPPRAIHELMRPAPPVVRGALVTRSAEEIQRLAEQAEGGVDDALAAAPAYRLARWLLDLAAERGGIPATQAGYVSTEIVRAGYERHIIPTPIDELREFFGGRDLGEELAEQLRPRKEADWQLFHELRVVFERAGLLRFDGRRFAVADGVSEFRAKPAALYRLLLEAMFVTAEWDHHARLGTMPGLRESAAFLLYVAGAPDESAVGDGWFGVERLTEAFLTAHPEVGAAAERDDRRASSFDPVEATISACFVSRFACPLGLFELRKRGEAVEIRPGPLYHIVFDNAACKW